MPQKYAADEVGRRGQKLYDERLRSLGAQTSTRSLATGDYLTTDIVVERKVLLSRGHGHSR